MRVQTLVGTSQEEVVTNNAEERCQPQVHGEIGEGGERNWEGRAVLCCPGEITGREKYKLTPMYTLERFSDAVKATAQVGIKKTPKK